MYHLRVIVLFLCVYAVVARPTSPKPVMIIPGLSASALYNTEWDDSRARVWVNESSMVGNKDYLENLKAVWNKTSGQVESYYNIDVYPSLEGVCKIATPVLIPRFSGFEDFVDWIHLHSGSADAAPYDWRMVPQTTYLNQWAITTRAQILSLHLRNKNNTVVVVAHSMGNFMANFLFHTSTPEFLKIIDSFVSVSPPWGGAGLGLRAVVYGMELIHILNWNYTIPMSLLDDFPCFPWIFPNNQTYETTHVIKINDQNYTSSNISLFFAGAGGSPVSSIMSHVTSTFNYSHIYKQPEVNFPYHLVYSHFEPTAIGIQMVEGYWDEIIEPYVGEDYGDGTVPFKSLTATTSLWEWASITPLRNKVKHGEIIKHLEFFEAVGKVIGTMEAPGRA